jgi:hypothetical protein
MRRPLGMTEPGGQTRRTPTEGAQRAAARFVLVGLRFAFPQDSHRRVL